MPNISISTVLPASAARVWDVIGDFSAFAGWHPAVQKSEVTDDGKRRTLTLFGGARIIELLERYNDQERLYSYAMIDSPLPVKECHSTIRITENDPHTVTVTWSSEFIPSGAPEAMAVEAMQQVYESGLSNLRDMFTT